MTNQTPRAHRGRQTGPHWGQLLDTLAGLTNVCVAELSDCEHGTPGRRNYDRALRQALRMLSQTRKYRDLFPDTEGQS